MKTLIAKSTFDYKDQEGNPIQVQSGYAYACKDEDAEDHVKCQLAEEVPEGLEATPGQRIFGAFIPVSQRLTLEDAGIKLPDNNTVRAITPIASPRPEVLNPPTPEAGTSRRTIARRTSGERADES